MHQRSIGALHLSFKRRDNGTVLDGLRQEGCLKARFPRPEPGAWAGAVTMNSSGGVAGGDRLALRVAARAGTRATVAAQATERFYRALPGMRASVVNTITLEPEAALEWLPQETILFDQCAFGRQLLLDMTGTGWFLGVESIVFGREAMGEAVTAAHIDDLITVRRDGRTILHDRTRFSGSVAALLQRRAIGAGSRAMATLVHVAPQAENRIQAVRAALAPFEAGASAWDGMLLARIVAQNGACLRAAVVAGLSVLRDGRPLPRVWVC